MWNCFIDVENLETLHKETVDAIEVTEPAEAEKVNSSSPITVITMGMSTLLS